MPTALLDPVLAELADDQAAIDPRQLAKMLRMTITEVAALSRIHRVTLSRSPGSPEVQARLGPIATILSRAADMSGSLSRAVLWFRHQPVAALGQKRPVDLVESDEAAAVLQWLDALEDGAYA